MECEQLLQKLIEAVEANTAILTELKEINTISGQTLSILKDEIIKINTFIGVDNG